MSTESQAVERLRALELSLQARREELEPDDRQFLDRYLAAHPDVGREAQVADSLLSRAAGAGVPIRPAFIGRMERAVASWVREDLLSRPPVTTSESGWRRAWSWMYGTREGASRAISWPTVLLGRSLAFYAGAAVAVCLTLSFSDPEPFQPVVNTGDHRPLLEAPQLPPEPAPLDDPLAPLRERRGK